jgi:hypothetical protein
VEHYSIYIIHVTYEKHYQNQARDEDIAVTVSISNLKGSVTTMKPSKHTTWTAFRQTQQPGDNRADRLQTDRERETEVNRRGLGYRPWRKVEPTRDKEV